MNLIVRGPSSAEILFLDSVRALHPTSSGGADLFGQSPVRVPPTSSGGTFSARTGTIGGRPVLCFSLHDAVEVHGREPVEEEAGGTRRTLPPCWSVDARTAAQVTERNSVNLGEFGLTRIVLNV